MVPATKDSKLKKTIDEKLKRLNLTKKVKIIEKPGPKFFDKLKILNRKPKINNCKDPNCLIQKTQNGGNCKINEIVYSIICKECGDRYTGETSRNGHSRSIEHVKDAKSENKKQKEKSVMLRHREEKHGGEEVPFAMKVVSSHQHDALGRQCAESVWIKEADPNKRINNKEEYHQPGDVEVIYHKNDKDIKNKPKTKNSASEEKEVSEEKTATNDQTEEKKEQRKITDFFYKKCKNRS